jgi:hypothetical protein
MRLWGTPFVNKGGMTYADVLLCFYCDSRLGCIVCFKSSSFLSSCVCVCGAFCLIRVALLSASVGGGVLAWDSLNKRGCQATEKCLQTFCCLAALHERAQSMLIESDGDQMLWMFLPSSRLHLMLIAVWGSAWTFGYTWPVL